MVHTAGVTVLGAGLTGAATALELASRGVEVTLVDRDERPGNRASLRNEGKIHLGLLYANDRSLASAAFQLRGALSFRRLLAAWVGREADGLACSTPFSYLVANDSLLTPDQLSSHYESVDELYRNHLKDDRTADYLGGRPECLWERQGAAGGLPFDPERVRAVFRTAELAIDTDRLAVLLRRAIAGSARIRFLPSHHVRSVERRNGAFDVEGSADGGAWKIRSDQVVNALWEGRLAIDRTAGVHVEPGWVHRLKYRVIARLPERLRAGPSATIVLGRYGDVVVRRDGTAYLSWYPSGLRGWTHDLSPPPAWDAPCRGEVDPREASGIAREFLHVLDDWYPGIADSEPIVVDAGSILAWGRSDVDDPSSALHNRSGGGVVSQEGYHSVEPGKLTTAPLVAVQAADAVLGAGVTV
jgi:glycine/D-amino acid oxidase-like deaminating enzyme